MKPDTIQQLRELPGLAAEVFLTWGHPNPTGRPPVATKRVFPPAPADLDALDCLRPGGLLFRLTQCVRAVVEEMPEHPADLDDPPTWVSESTWLAAHASDWQPDAFLAEFVATEVNEIHRELSRVARMQPPLHLECPRCRDILRVQPGERWLRCDSGHVIDSGPEIERAGRLVSMTYAELSRELGIPEGTLRRWRHDRLIHPDIERRGGQLVFNAEAVRRVAAIQAR
nr:MAG TPA: antitoxin [Caudoviricetes sp.]